MKQHLLLMVAAMMIMAGCQNQNNKTNTTNKTTENDVKKAEAALFNGDMSVNPEAAKAAIATFGNYATDNPEATNAAEYLFKAFEVSVNTKQDPKRSIGLADRMLNEYPNDDKIPVMLFMLASFVYEDQLDDLDQARATYQRIIDNYPESPFANDAAIAITQVGMTPDELIKMFENNQ